MSSPAPLPQWPAHPRRSRIGGWIWKTLGVISFAMIFLWPFVFMAGGVIAPDDLNSFQSGGFELGMLVFGLIGVKCYMRGKRHFAIAATELLSKDPRPPVIYLRSFQHDKKGAGSAAGSRYWGGWAALFDLKTVEERLAEALTPIGPVVAIGKPGEKLPALGAARLYVGDDEWQETIRVLMERAKLVVLLLGDTPGFWWELERSVKDLPPERLVLLVPFRKTRYDAFREQAASHFAHPLPDYSTRSWWMVPIVLMGLAAAAGAPFGTDAMLGAAMLAGLVSLGFRPRRGLGKLAGLIYFRRDWTSEWVDLTTIKPARGFRLNFYGHNRMKKSLGWNLRPVFAQLGLDWQPPKVRRGYLALGAVAASILAIGVVGSASMSLSAWRELRAHDAAREPFLRGVPDEARGRALARAGMVRLDDADVRERARLIGVQWSDTTEVCLPAVLEGADPVPTHAGMRFMPPGDVATWYRLLASAARAESGGDPGRVPSVEETRDAFRAFSDSMPQVSYHDVLFIVRGRTASAGIQRFIDSLQLSEPFGFVQVYPSQVCGVFGAMHRAAAVLPAPHGTNLARALAAAMQ